MSWVTPTIIMIVVGFAISFALSEWIALRRRTRRDDDDPATT